MINRIVFFSGGIASFAVAAYVKETFPEDNILLYFTDTKWEHPDTYRFMNEGAEKLNLPLLIHDSDMNPMQLMFEKKLIYNNRIGDCSKLLKQKVARDFLKYGKKPVNEFWRNKNILLSSDFTKDAVLYFGIGFEEMHRETKIYENWLPFKTEFPLIYNNIDRNHALNRYQIKRPELYNFGFSHNNCYARCVKAGQGHFKLLRDQMPDRFQKLKEQEHHLMICVSSYRYITDTANEIPEDVQKGLLTKLDDAYRDYFYDRADKPDLYIHPAAGTDMRFIIYSFMKKQKKPYLIKDMDLELRQSKDLQIDMFDIGGCGCFVEI